jgi:hypothetical protein
VRVARLVALLGLSGAGLVYREAIAQEVMGQYRWRMATGPTVLMVEQEKAKAGKPGSDPVRTWQKFNAQAKSYKL